MPSKKKRTAPAAKSRAKTIRPRAAARKAKPRKVGKRTLAAAKELDAKSAEDSTGPGRGPTTGITAHRHEGAPESVPQQAGPQPVSGMPESSESSDSE